MTNKSVVTYLYVKKYQSIKFLVGPTSKMVGRRCANATQYMLRLLGCDQCQLLLNVGPASQPVDQR